MSTRILIVDDDASMRRLVRLSLEVQSNWAVCGEAADGVEGVEKAAALRPDLIVLDHSMPRMDGLEAARAIRKTMPLVPIVLFTGSGGEQLCSEARDAGIASVVSKKDPMDELCDEVRKLTGSLRCVDQPAKS